MKRCPFCAEEIQDQALICRHCGRDVVPPHVRSLANRWQAFRDQERQTEWGRLAPNDQAMLRAVLAGGAGVHPAGPVRARYEWTAGKIGCAVAAVALLGAFIISLTSGGRSPQPRVTTFAPESAAAPPPAAVGTPPLELGSWNWGEEGTYAIARGEVTNVSAQSLRNVQAVVSFYTSDGTFITSADSLIDFNPVLPGQTAPFSVMEQWNPRMETARIAFKELMGGSIAYRKKGDTP